MGGTHPPDHRHAPHREAPAPARQGAGTGDGGLSGDTVDEDAGPALTDLPRSEGPEPPGLRPGDPSAGRRKLLADLAAYLVRSARGRRLIGIDGVDGSGKTSFSAGLAAELAASAPTRPVLLIHLDDFLQPAAVRHRRGRSSPMGFWLDTYDYAEFRRSVLDPLAPGGDGRYRPAPPRVLEARGERIGWRPAPVDALVIVEGMFLHRDGLTVWDHSVFLAVPFAETARRMALRDGTHPDPEHPSMRRYVGGQRLYFAAAQPWRRAAMVIDNTDPGLPRIIPSEECGYRADRR